MTERAETQFRPHEKRLGRCNIDRSLASLSILLPDEGYRLITLHFYQSKVGTVFEGVPQPDLTIFEFLRKQAVF